MRDLEVWLDHLDLSAGGGGTPLWPARSVCVCVRACGDPECVQRGVGVEVCPAEPPLDLGS